MKNLKNCFICGHKDMKFYFKKLGYGFYRCKECGFISLDFKEKYHDFIKRYYLEGYFTGDKKLRAYADYEGDRSVEKKNMKRYLNLIGKYKKTGKLLDVGCALGFLMEEAEKLGYDSYGVDVSEYAITKARNKFGEKVILGEISDTSFSNNSFNIITMFDLIEHLKTPHEDFKKIYDILSNDGMLVIQTGDSSSFWAKLNKRNWHFFAPPQHLFFYNQCNINEFLRQSGFKIIKINKIGKWVSLRYLFHMMSYVGGEGLGSLLFNLVKGNFIGRIPIFLRFNDNMIIFAKKQ